MGQFSCPITVADQPFAREQKMHRGQHRVRLTPRLLVAEILEADGRRKILGANGGNDRLQFILALAVQRFGLRVGAIR